MVGGLITGVVGKITWSYFNAAAINGYTIARMKTPTGSQWSLVATVVVSDKYKMAQHPLVFVAPYARGVWRWPIVSFELSGGHLIAQLGPPIEG